MPDYTDDRESRLEVQLVGHGPDRHLVLAEITAMMMGVAGVSVEEDRAEHRTRGLDTISVVVTSGALVSMYHAIRRYTTGRNISFMISVGRRRLEMGKVSSPEEFRAWVIAAKEEPPK